MRFALISLIAFLFLLGCAKIRPLSYKQQKGFDIQHMQTFNTALLGTKSTIVKDFNKAFVKKFGTSYVAFSSALGVLQNELEDRIGSPYLNVIEDEATDYVFSLDKRSPDSEEALHEFLDKQTSNFIICLKQITFEKEYEFPHSNMENINHYKGTEYVIATIDVDIWDAFEKKKVSSFQVKGREPIKFYRYQAALDESLKAGTVKIARFLAQEGMGTEIEDVILPQDSITANSTAGTIISKETK